MSKVTIEQSRLDELEAWEEAGSLHASTPGELHTIIGIKDSIIYRFKAIVPSVSGPKDLKAIIEELSNELARTKKEITSLRQKTEDRK